MKTVWRSQNAFVAIKTNYIARTLKEGGAMTTLSKMLIERRSLDGVEIVIDIV
jgi:hypothetical protein